MKPVFSPIPLYYSSFGYSTTLSSFHLTIGNNSSTIILPYLSQVQCQQNRQCCGNIRGYNPCWGVNFLNPYIIHYYRKTYTRRKLIRCKLQTNANSKHPRNNNFPIKSGKYIFHIELILYITYTYVVQKEKNIIGISDGNIHEYKTT